MTDKMRPNGLGMWTAYPGALLQRFGSWTAIAAHLTSLGVWWLAARTTAPELAGANLEGAVRAMHAAGIRFYGWHYSYPDANRVSTQVKHMVRCQAAGADGHIVNAEIEFTGKQLEAVRLGEAIRTVLPDWYVAHAPLGWIDYHPTWPYEEFAAWTDDVHPQMYWTELKDGKYSPSFSAQMKARWESGFRHGIIDTSKDWVELTNGKRICPIGATYGKGDVVGLAEAKQPPGKFDVNDMQTYLSSLTHQLSCVSLYSLEVAHPSAIAWLRAYAGPGDEPAA